MKEREAVDGRSALRAGREEQVPRAPTPSYVFRDVYLEGVPVHMDGVRLDWDGGSTGGNEGPDILLRRSDGSSIRNLYFGPSAAQLAAAPLTPLEELSRRFAYEVLTIDDRGDDFVVVIAGTSRVVDIVVLPTGGLRPAGSVDLEHALKRAQEVVAERTGEGTPPAVPELVIVVSKQLPPEGSGGVPYWFLTAVTGGVPPVFAERRGEDDWIQIDPRALTTEQTAAAEALAAQHLSPAPTGD